MAARYHFAGVVRGLNPRHFVEGNPSVRAYRQHLADTLGGPPERYNAFLHRFIVAALDDVEARFGNELSTHLDAIVEIRGQLKTLYKGLLRIDPADLASPSTSPAGLRQNRLQLEALFRDLESHIEALEQLDPDQFVGATREEVVPDIAGLADERHHAIDPDTGELYVPRPERVAPPEDSLPELEPTLDLDDPVDLTTPREPRHRPPRPARRPRLGAEAERAISDLGALAEDAVQLRAIDRLAERRYEALLIELATEPDANTPRYLQAIEGLSDDAVRGLDIVREYNEMGRSLLWSDFLEFDPASREGTLTLIQDVAPHSDATFLKVLRDIDTDAPSRPNKAGAFFVTQIQGSLGQLLAARTLLRQHPGARLSFEVSMIGGGRRYDIIVHASGGAIHVEVKTNLQGASGRTSPSSPSSGNARTEAHQDILLHAGNDFRTLIWMFHPDLSTRQLNNIRKAFRDLITGDAADDLHARGIDPADAEAAFLALESQIVQHYDL